MRFVEALGLVCAALLFSLPAQAATRVALVVGNADYVAAGRLSNPANDARIVGDALRRSGFDVISAGDTSLAQFRSVLRDFRTKALGADMAMVYYAGHGIEANARNWLIPVDAQLQSEFDLADEAVDLERVLEALEGAKVRIVVLDACRNNPFGRSWPRGKRSLNRGLAPVEIDDVLVIYAAASGQVANDGEGGNSPFARSLAQRLIEPNLPLQLLGGAVRDDVLASTAGAQRPFVSASMTGTPIYLIPGAAAPRERAELIAPRPAAPVGGGIDVGALIGECNRLAGAQLPVEEILPLLAVPACRRAQEAAPLDAGMSRQLGRSHLAAKDYGGARKWFEQAASEQDAGGMYGLAQLYLSGWGVDQDYAQARRWLEQAAAKGEAQAMFALGYLYLAGNGVVQDYGQARAWYEQAAAREHPGAMFMLGALHFDGKGVAKDFALARKWYEQASAKDHPIAMKNLGVIHYNGLGVTQDFAQARKWFEQAVAKGDAEAMVFLAEMHGNGRGIPSDWVQARLLYEQAAARDNAFAMRMLGLIYENGTGVATDSALARNWYERAAAKGNQDARNWLAKHKK